MPSTTSEELRARAVERAIADLGVQLDDRLALIEAGMRAAWYLEGLTVAEAAEALGVSETRVRALIASGKLPATGERPVRVPRLAVIERRERLRATSGTQNQPSGLA